MTFNGYNTGATYDVNATVTATDANSNAATQDITVKVRDVGGIDDNPAKQELVQILILILQQKVQILILILIGKNWNLELGTWN